MVMGRGLGMDAGHGCGTMEVGWVNSGRGVMLRMGLGLLWLVIWCDGFGALIVGLSKLAWQERFNDGCQ